VHEVDISGEMVRLARATLADYPNAHVYQNSGADLSVVPDVPFDFVFSTIVFQHIDSHAIIESYVREVRRLLRPGRLFKFDVNGVIAGPLSRRVIVAVARTVVPKNPRIHRGHRNWVGQPYTPAEVQELADKTGFELRYQDGAGSQNYWLWLFKR
jgi:SAM-dependent methyltransferase